MTSRTSAFAATLLASASVVAVAPEPARAAPANDAVSALVRQGDYWRGRGRKDLADEAMKRALAAAPKNPEVLAAMARFAAADGDQAAAARWTAQLRAAAPNDPLLAQLAQQQKATPPAQGLAQARRLAQGGQTDQAAAAYRGLFGGGAPPAAYRLEYYQTLAGSQAHWEEGRKGLQALASERPDDTQAKLAYAQALTYREPTRRDGIGRLSSLRSAPGNVGEQARRVWRQALIWLGAGARDKPLYQAFLEVSPNDAEIQAKLARIDSDLAAAAPKPPAPPTAAERAATVRTEGFAALEKDDVAGAERRFQEALKLKPNDGDALGGLGLIRLRQQSFAEARDLLRRAIDAAPASRARWQEALAAASFFSDYREASAAAERNDWVRAEALVRPLIEKASGENRRLARQLLGDTLSRQNRWAEAEGAYRQVLAEKTDSAEARIGLIESLLAQNRSPEAQALAATPAERAAFTEARGRIELARANQAWAAGDLRNATSAFNAALAARPADAWTRYDYARFLDEQGQASAADGLIAPLADAAASEPLYVAALFAQRRGQASQGYSLLTRIPQAQRTSTITALMGQLRVSTLVESAEAARKAGRSYEALAALRGLAAQPDLPIGAQGQVAMGLYDLGDTGPALALAQNALFNPDKQNPAAYDGFVAVLTRAGRDAEASALIRQLSDGNSSVAARRAVNDLIVTQGAERADRLRLSGDLAGAFDTLSASFAYAPGSLRLLSTLGRLYQAGGLSEQAGGVFEQVLRQKPGDYDALVGVAQAAAARRDWAGAKRTLTQAMTLSPNNPDLYVLAASIEEGSGDKRAAVRALETARSLRQRQFAGAPPAAPGFAAAPAPGMGLLGPNPFAPGAMVPQRQDYAPTTAYAPIPALFENTNGPARLRTVAYDPGVMAAAAPQTQLPMPATPSYGSTPSYTQAPAYAPAPPYAPPAYPAQPYAPPIYAQAPAYPAYPAPQAYAPPAQPPAYAPQSPAYPANPFGQRAAIDPLTAAIDARIADLSDEVRPWVEAHTDYRGRSGEAGLSNLDDLNATLSINVSPFDAGRFFVAIKPVNLDAGEATGDSLTRVGSNPYELGLSRANTTTATLTKPTVTSQSGVGVQVGYAAGPLALDVESTPLGFDDTQVGGGLSFSPRIGEHGQAKVWVERRPVTDSLTAYAGAYDPATGIRWGQVMRSTAGGSFSYDNDKSGFYADFALSGYAGRNVADNAGYQANLGAYIRPYVTETSRLQVGVNLNQQAYDNNQNFFTVGHGGYFSPKRFTSLSLPIEYRTVSGDWTFQAQAAPGYQTYTQEGALIFPDNPTLQGAMDSLSARNALVPRTYAGGSSSGFGISGKVLAEYRFSSNVAVGGNLGFNNFGNYNETSVGLYAKQYFGEGAR